MSQTGEGELLAACKDLREACAALMRAVHNNVLTELAFDEWEAELKAMDLIGFGKRADEAIDKAEGR